LAVELRAVAEVEAEEIFRTGDAVGEVGGGVGGGELFLELGFVQGHGDLDLGGFGEPKALLPPFGVSGLGDEVILIAVLGLVSGDVLGEKDAELGFVFGLEEAAFGEGVDEVGGRRLAGESVFGGVEGGVGFAVSGAGSGGLEGVAAVGVDAALGGH